MFFLYNLEKNIQLHPKYFGANLRATLIKKLKSEVEGTCTARFGYIITVTKVEDPEPGKIHESTGFATFMMKYEAIIFRPFRGEVVDAVVTRVNKMGFFAEAGPLQIFVSGHCIPNDMEFDANTSSYTAGSIKIEKDSEVRLKIVGTTYNAPELFAIGTIRENFLGPI